MVRGPEKFGNHKSTHRAEIRKIVPIPDHLQPVNGVESFADVCGSGEGRNRRLFPLDCCVQLVFNVLTVFHGAGFRDFTISHTHVG